MRPQQRLVVLKRLIGINHQAEIVANGVADSRQPGAVLRQMRLADLDL